MARPPRIVLPGYYHHITQRGAHRQCVFFEDADRELYLDMLGFYCTRYDVRIGGLCLMNNHVHHLVKPPTKDSLRWVFQPLHRRFAIAINQKHGWTGHLWQERFYSSPVENDYLPIVARYIDCNPLHAGLVADPLDYPWSSARYHSGLTTEIKLTIDTEIFKYITKVGNWGEYLLKDENPRLIRQLEEVSHRYLPFGSEGFICKLEKKLDRILRPRRCGRPQKTLSG